MPGRTWAEGSGPEPVSGSGGAVTWRLVGANNHELGRSPQAHSSLAVCVAAVALLQGEVERTMPVLALSDRTGAWTWQLVLDERRVAVAVRGYLRQRECRNSLELFVSAAAAAQVASGVTYTRRLRGLQPPDADDAMTARFSGAPDSAPDSASAPALRRPAVAQYPGCRVARGGAS